MLKWDSPHATYWTAPDRDRQVWWVSRRAAQWRVELFDRRTGKSQMLGTYTTLDAARAFCEGRTETDAA